MFAPARALLPFRSHATPALLVAAASVAFHFATTPFLIPAIANSYEVSLGAAGLISVAQVGGFTASNLFAGRRLVPRRRLLIGAAIVGVATNAASALPIAFAMLLVLRATAGAAAGLVTWLAWTEAMRDVRALRDVSGVGPLTALAASPAVAWLIAVADERIVFIAIAVSCLPAAFMRTTFDESPVPARRKMSPSRSNVVLLIALGIMTAAGSSLFVFAGSIGETRVQLDPVLVSLAFSANAAAGLAATRRQRTTTKPWLWLAVIGACAGAVAFGTFAVLFYAAMALWGYAFWRAVPAVLQDVAAWSLVPEERTGDAQGVMALGRTLGPAAGGALLGAGSFTGVGIEAVAGVWVSAALVLLVSRYRLLHPDRRPLAS